MPTLKPRSRVVVFRLSDEEYDALQATCQDKGGRNVSEFLRTELLTVVGRSWNGDALERRLATIARRLAEVKSSVQRNHELLERIAKLRS